MGCSKSYSKEHSFVPFGEDKVKCVLCGKVEAIRKAEVLKPLRS